MNAEQIVTNLLEADEFDPKRIVNDLEQRHPDYASLTIDKLDPFTQQYLATAFWTEEERLKEEATENGLNPDEHDFEWSQSALQSAKEDCDKFREAHSELLDQAGDDEQNAHDFWLTRNGHGAGFWDRGYPDEIGDALTEACRAFREKTAYLGDDGLIYFF